MDRELHEECGVFGIIGHQDASQICYYGLHSLQHRGQEAAGICCENNGKMIFHKGEGQNLHRSLCIAMHFQGMELLSLRNDALPNISYPD